MSDSKARLHCCGAHHHDSHTQAGVHLLLPLIESTTGPQSIECYGTGENEDSAVLFIPNETYAWDNLHTRLLADRIARGSNVTVILPHLTHERRADDSTSQKRSRETAFDARETALSMPCSKETCIALLKHLKSRMDVSFLGLFGASSSSSSDPRSVVDTLPKLANVQEESQLNCAVIVVPDDGDIQDKTQPYLIPTSLLTVGRETKETEISEDPILLRNTTIVTDHGAGFLKHEDHASYESAMKETIYFFKKHLHDWS